MIIIYIVISGWKLILERMLTVGLRQLCSVARVLRGMRNNRGVVL